MSDKNWISFTESDAAGIRNFDEIIPPGADYSDALKFSHASGITVRVKRIVGGLEDVVDCNRFVSDCHVYADLIEPRGLHILTVKGGTDNFSISGDVGGHGRSCDLEKDMWSDQANSPSRNIRINLKTRDGSPITYRTWGGPDFIFENKNTQTYKCLFALPCVLRPFFIFGYGLAKKIALVFGKNI